MGKILIGVSSWSDKSLVESDYYPSEIKTAAERLQYYSRSFAVAEIDSSYHFFPTRQNLSLWLDNTPAGFTFDVKAFSLFTRHPTPFNSLPRGIRDKYGDQIKAKGNVYQHHLPEEAINELWDGFNRTVQVIASAGKLGVVLFQFPPWFHVHQDSFDYLARCRERLSAFEVAVEFRVAGWLNDDNKETTLQFLREHGLSLVCVDEPQGFKSSVPPVAEVTAATGFVRFHGRNSENWEQKGISTDEKYKYLYSESELQEWAPKIREMADKAANLHIIFKNKYADFPVRNAQQMGRILESKRPPK